MFTLIDIEGVKIDSVVTEGEPTTRVVLKLENGMRVVFTAMTAQFKDGTVKHYISSSISENTEVSHGVRHERN